MAINYDGDATPDIVITESAFTGGAVYRGANPASFTFTSGVGEVVGADFDGDGRQDLVIDLFSGPVVLKGNPGPLLSFAAPVQLNAQIGYHALALADYNRDGLPDVAVSTYDIGPTGGDRVDIYLGDRTRLLVPAATVSGLRAIQLAASDINGDSIVDLTAATAYGVVVHLGVGNGTFGARRTLASATTRNRSVAFGDLNNDGRPDFVAGAHTTDLVVFLSDP